MKKEFNLVLHLQRRNERQEIINRLVERVNEVLKKHNLPEEEKSVR